MQTQKNLALALEQGGYLEAAVKEYEAVIIKFPDDAKIRVRLANILRDMQRLDDAIYHYNQALQIDPGYINAHYNLGATFGLQGHEEKAIAAYQDVLRLNPKDDRAYCGIAISFAALGELSAAKDAARTALQINDQNALAHGVLASTLILQGNLIAIIFELHKTLTLNPADENAQAMLKKGRHLIALLQRN